MGRTLPVRQRANLQTPAENISLAGLPDFILYDRQGSEQEFTAWMTEIITKRVLDTPAKRRKFDTDPLVNARISAQINYIVMSRTKSLKDTADRAFIWQTFKANETGWFRHLGMEFDTIKELLASLVDASEAGTTEYYNLAFLTETAIPLLEAQGVPAEDVVGIPFLSGKAAKIVPAMRDLMICPECGARTHHNGTSCHRGHALEIAPENVEKAAALARMVVDLPGAELDAKVAEMRGREMKAAPQIPQAYQYIITPGTDWFLVPCSGPEQRRAVEIALQGIVVHFQMADIKSLANELVQQVFGKSIAVPAAAALQEETF